MTADTGSQRHGNLPDTDQASGRTAIRPVLAVGLGIVVLAVALPLWASLTYRSAVHGLHGELAAVAVDSADVADARIERCWNDVGPASVRTLVPTGDQTLTAVVTDYLAALEPLGFESQAGVVGRVASRPRTDDLDDDVITVTIDDATKRITVVADPFDADMVVCLPF